jgi:hypothetical protein
MTPRASPHRVAAFYDDPVFRWFSPHDQRRGAMLPDFFRRVRGRVPEPRRDVHRRRRFGGRVVGRSGHRSAERRAGLRAAPRGGRRRRCAAALRDRRAARGTCAARTPLPPAVPSGASETSGRRPRSSPHGARFSSAATATACPPTWRQRATATAPCTKATASRPATTSRCPAGPRLAHVARPSRLGPARDGRPVVVGRPARSASVIAGAPPLRKPGPAPARFVGVSGLGGPSPSPCARRASRRSCGRSRAGRNLASRATRAA